MGVPESVSELLTPVVANLGVELVDVEHNGAVLRLIVDKEDGVDTDTLARINRLVSPMLDEHDPISGRYTLEVSSPGVERKLKTLDHFQRALDETIVVKLAPHCDIRRLKGGLVAVGDENFTIRASEVDGVDQAEIVEHIVDLADVLKARTIFDWGPTPKSGGSKNGKQKKSAKKSASHKGSGKQTNKQGSGTANPGTQDRGTS